jgi:hypothetical protein
MGFPAVIAEVAFDNDVNEYLYAQTGYSDVTKFVRAVSGDLRGRRYEMDRVETGSLRITFDNGDGRFTPHKAESPYYPNVKPSRRFRLRGKNMQRLNLASAGSQLQLVRGFDDDDGTYTAIANAPTLVASTDTTSPLRTLAHTNEIRCPDTTATTTFSATSGTLSIEDGLLRLTANASAQSKVWANPASNEFPAVQNDKVALQVVVGGDDTKDLYARVMVQAYNSSHTTITGGPEGTYTLVPANETVTLSVVGTFANANTAGYKPYVQISSTAGGANVVSGDYVDTGRWFVEDGTTAADATADIEFFSGATADRLSTDGLALEHAWTGTADASSSTQISHPIGAGTHHVEVTVPSGLTGGTTYGLAEFNVPLEIGRRLAHTAYIWKVSGTRAAGTTALVIRYYASDGSVLTEAPLTSWTSEATSPTRRAVAHACPVTAQYAKAHLIYTPTSGPTANSFVMGIDCVQTENTPNLALNPWGQTDATYWYVTGENDTECAQDSGTSSVAATMALDDVEMLTYIPGLIPGDTYTVYIELRHYNATGGTPTKSLRVSADDGLTYTDTTGQGAFTSAVYTFVADSPMQKLSISLADGTLFVANWKVCAKGLNIVEGSTSPGAHVDGSEDDITAWESPMPVFEGWIEAWPVKVNAGSAEVTVVANDRLKRLGGITLQSTWREAIYADNMQLAIPFDDDPTDAAGYVAQVGSWASEFQFIDVPVQATRGDIGAAVYTLGVDGPTDQTAIEFDPTGSTVGYFVPVPWSNDYTAPTPPAPPPPKPPTTPKPPPRDATYTTRYYTKTYPATWSRTYDGDGSTTWDDTAYMMQGYFDSNRGNTRSLAGFNWAAIKADLAGSTVTACFVTLYDHSFYAFSGGTVYVGTHNYSTKPSTWSGTSVAERLYSKHCDYGGSVVINLGVAIGNAFKAATNKGIAIGPAPSTSVGYYAHFHGAGHGSQRPVLTIKFARRVRVS